MTDFIEGESRSQATLFPERLDDYISEENPVRVIDVFVDELDIGSLGFKTHPEETAPCLPSRDATKDLPIRLLESCSINSPPGARDTTQC